MKENSLSFTSTLITWGLKKVSLSLMRLMELSISLFDFWTTSFLLSVSLVGWTFIFRHDWQLVLYYYGLGYWLKPLYALFCDLYWWPFLAQLLVMEQFQKAIYDCNLALGERLVVLCNLALAERLVVLWNVALAERLVVLWNVALAERLVVLCNLALAERLVVLWNVALAERLVVLWNVALAERLVVLCNLALAERLVVLWN